MFSDRQTDGQNFYRCSYVRGICTEKIDPYLNYIVAEKISFLPEPERQMDISSYRVASLLKRKEYEISYLQLFAIRSKMNVMNL